jgi:hypothetical protein
VFLYILPLISCQAFRITFASTTHTLSSAGKLTLPTTPITKPSIVVTDKFYSTRTTVHANGPSIRST